MLRLIRAAIGKQLQNYSSSAVLGLSRWVADSPLSSDLPPAALEKAVLFQRVAAYMWEEAIPAADSEDDRSLREWMDRLAAVLDDRCMKELQSVDALHAKFAGTTTAAALEPRAWAGICFFRPNRSRPDQKICGSEQHATTNFSGLSGIMSTLYGMVPLLRAMRQASAAWAAHSLAQLSFSAQGEKQVHPEMQHQWKKDKAEEAIRSFHHLDVSVHKVSDAVLLLATVVPRDTALAQVRTVLLETLDMASEVLQHSSYDPTCCCIAFSFKRRGAPFSRRSAHKQLIRQMERMGDAAQVFQQALHNVSACIVSVTRAETKALQSNASVGEKKEPLLAPETAQPPRLGIVPTVDALCVHASAFALLELCRDLQSVLRQVLNCTP